MTGGHSVVLTAEMKPIISQADEAPVILTPTEAVRGSPLMVGDAFKTLSLFELRI